MVEQRFNEEVGMHNGLFRERLQAAIVADRERMVPDTVGYNANPIVPDSRPVWYRDMTAVEVAYEA